MTARISIRLLVCCALVLGLAAPGIAWPNDSEQPGSVLVYHKWILDETDIKVSVTCPNQLRDENGNCMALGQSVKIMFHWVCPGELNEAGENVCREFDFTLSTTINGTIEFNARGEVEPETAGFVPEAPCERGYLIAWVVNPDSNQPIKFDGLIGHAVIEEDELGFPTNLTSSRAYNALPIQAAEWLNTGDPTDQDGDQALDFDDNEYRAITGKIYGSGIEYDERTELTLLTLDVRSNLPNETTFVGLDFFDENEVLQSVATNFTCWSSTRVDDLGVSLDSDDGSVESTGAMSSSGNPVTLVGILETVEFTDLPVTVPGFNVTVPTLSLPLLPPGIPLPPGCSRRDFPTAMPPRTEIRCTVAVPPRFLDIPVVQDHAYSLYHDGKPVPTTFVPRIGGNGPDIVPE